MVQNTERTTPGNGNDMQDMEVQGVPGPGQSQSRDGGGDRYLNTRTLLSHYRHLQGRGRLSLTGCPVCVNGLEGALIPIEEKKPEPVVVPSDRADEGKTDSHAPDNWWDA